jgi:predicted dehydrogenase
MAKKLRVGIISANWGMQSHMPAWRLQPDAEVVAVCTSRQETAEAAAREFGIERPFWDYEAMCADPDIDVIDCGTNPALREKMVMAAIANGKHAVNQLPFAMSGEAATRIAEAQQAAGVKGIAAAGMVGLPQVAYIRDLIADGAIGEVFQVHCSWNLSYYLPIIPQFPYVWFGKSGHGVSVTRNQGSHLLHLLRHLLGPVEALTANMDTRLKQWRLDDGTMMDVETDDTLHALLRFSSGVMGNLTTSWTTVDSPGFALDLFGSKGRLRLEGFRFPGAFNSRLYRAEVAHGMAPTGQEIPLPQEYLRLGDQILDPSFAKDPAAGEQLPSMTRLFRSMADAIANDSEPLASFGRAKEIQLMVEALYLAHQEGRWVSDLW